MHETIYSTDTVNRFSATRVETWPNLGIIFSYALPEYDLQQAFSSVFPGIMKKEGVCGGDACIEGTRIPVWTLVQFKKMGADEEKLLSMYPTLTLPDLIRAFSYYDLNKHEIDRQIYENEHA